MGNRASGVESPRADDRIRLATATESPPATSQPAESANTQRAPTVTFSGPPGPITGPLKFPLPTLFGEPPRSGEFYPAGMYPDPANPDEIIWAPPVVKEDEISEERKLEEFKRQTYEELKKYPVLERALRGLAELDPENPTPNSKPILEDAFQAASSYLVYDAQAGRITSLSSEQESLRDELKHVRTEKLYVRAAGVNARMLSLEAELKDARERLNDLETDQRLSRISQIRRNRDLVSFERVEDIYVGRIDSLRSRIAALEAELASLCTSLKGLAEVIIHHMSMLAMAQGKHNDEILGQAGKIAASFGLTKEAFDFFKSAKEYAVSISDSLSSLEYEMQMILHDDSIKGEQRLKRLKLLVKTIEKNRNDLFVNPSAEFSEIMPLLAGTADFEQLKLAFEREYSRIRSEAISHMTSIAAYYAGDDVDNEGFQVQLGVLDEEMEKALGDSNLTAEQVLSLVNGYTSAIEPFVQAAAKATSDLDLKGRKALIDPIMARAEKVETLYRKLVEISKEAASDEELSEAMGAFGAQSYFYSQQRTGFAYSAAVSFFEKVVPNYPKSQNIDGVTASVRISAPHLFTTKGDYIPAASHQMPGDAKNARTEVELGHILVGSFLQQFGADLAGGTILGGVGAKGGAAVGGFFGGPAGAGVGGSIGGITGFFAGEVGGVAALRAAYSSEIEELAKQAERAGMDLAGLKDGEGYKNVVETTGFGMVGAVFAPAGGRGAKAAFEKLGKIFGKEGRRYYFSKVLPQEGRRFVKLGPAIVYGIAGIFGITGRNGREAILLPVAQQITELLRSGKGARDELGGVVKEIVRQARELLSKDFVSAFGESSGAICERLSARLLSLEADLLKDFGKILNKVATDQIDRSSFEKALAKLFKTGTDDDIVSETANAIFGHTSENARGIASSILRNLGGPADPKAFATALRLVLASANDTLISNLARVVGPNDASSLIKLARLVGQEGERVVQLEDVMKRMWDKKAGHPLLETMLTAKTREQVKAAVIKEGGVIDPHALADLISDGEQQTLWKAVRGVLSNEGRVNPLTTSEFFEKAIQVPGVREFLDSCNFAESARRRLTAGFLGEISENPDRLRRFVTVVLGGGIEKKAARNLPEATKEAMKAVKEGLLDVLIDSAGKRPEANKQLRLALKDIVRKRLRNWRSESLSTIRDVEIRGMRRQQRRALSHAITMADGPGKDFARMIFDNLSPLQAARYGGSEILREEAITAMQAETRKALSDALGQTFKYRSEENHWLNWGARRFINDPYDIVAGPVDRFLQRRLESASRAIIARDPNMSFRSHFGFWRKELLRQARLVGVAAAKKGDGPTPRWVEALESANEFMSRKVGTEQVRRAHRLCAPIAIADALRSRFSEDGELSGLGIFCTMIGGNYYLQKLDISATYGLDIAAIQRSFGNYLWKVDEDSDNTFDRNRLLGTYNEMILGQWLQGYAMYGINFAERTALGQVVGQLPFVTRLPLAANGVPAFRFFRGQLSKPDYIAGAGFWGGIGGVAFTGVTSTIQSFGIGTLTKGTWALNAGGTQNYPGWRGLNYAVNGPLVNVPGFWVNKVLESKNPEADLRSSLRQIVERIIGTGTQYATLQFMDPLAGKGEWAPKLTRITTAAARARAEAKAKAALPHAVPVSTVVAKTPEKLAEGSVVTAPEESPFMFFANRLKLNIVGMWDRWNVKLWLPSVGRSPGRSSLPPRPFEKSMDLQQLRSWFTERKMEFSDKKEHQGWLVEIAKKDPAALEEFLKDFEENWLIPTDAKWQTTSWDFNREAYGKAVYYFSLIAKYYAYLYRNGRKEFEPFAKLVTRSPRKKYWETVPQCISEDDLEKTFFRMEDEGKVFDGLTLDHLLATIRVEAITGEPLK